MRGYAGKDPSRGQRLLWWQEQLGHLTVANLNGESDPINLALRRLQRHGWYRKGDDAKTGKLNMHSKDTVIAPATVNRYATALGAVLSWAKDEQITPKGWVSPMSQQLNGESGLYRKQEAAIGRLQVFFSRRSYQSQRSNDGLLLDRKGVPRGAGGSWPNTRLASARTKY